MLLLMIMPALLGMAFFMDFGDDNDDSAADTASDADTVDTSSDAVSNGTEGDDLIVTGDDADRISGDDGNDVIDSAGGDDTVFGGAGVDLIFGGEGDDRLFGNSDPDLIEGQEGDDSIYLGDGNDESGTSMFVAKTEGELATAVNFQAGDDLIRGGAGDDTIIDMVGSNTLYGEQGDDYIIAYEAFSGSSSAADTLNGGQGNDTLAGDNGDSMTGGPGSDTFYVGEDLDTSANTVTVTDFDPAEDTLVLDIYGSDVSGVSTSEPIDLTETAEGLMVSFRGEDLALLEDVTMADLPSDTSSLFTIYV